MKKSFLLCLMALITGNLLVSQELLVKYYDDQETEINTETLKVGDFVVIKHAVEGKTPHYFQGKITGLLKDKGEIRVFDYARSTRVMPIVGKKIDLKEILAISKLDNKKSEGRQGRAIVGTAAGALGGLVGGGAGNTLLFGSAIGKGVSDGLSREKIDNQNVKCEIIDK